MLDTIVYLMGYAIKIRYAIHHPSYVEWKLMASEKWVDEHDVLDLVLRYHYSNYIEAACREHSFYLEEANSRGWPEPDDDIPF